MNRIVQDILHIIQPRLELEPTVLSTAAARGAAHVTLNTCTTWGHWAQDWATPCSAEQELSLPDLQLQKLTRILKLTGRKREFYLLESPNFLNSANSKVCFLFSEMNIWKINSWLDLVKELR